MVLIAINVVVYMITAAQGGGINLPGGQLFNDWALQGASVANGDWWRLVDAMFLHGSILHLALQHARPLLARHDHRAGARDAAIPARLLRLGTRRIGGSALVQLGRSPSPSEPPGAIFGLIGALLILEYLATGSLMGQAMVLILVNLAFTFAVPGISIGGHIGGLAGGIVATYALMRFRMPPNRALGFAIAVGVGVSPASCSRTSRVRGYGV